MPWPSDIGGGTSSGSGAGGGASSAGSGGSDPIELPGSSSETSFFAGLREAFFSLFFQRLGPDNSADRPARPGERDGEARSGKGKAKQSPKGPSDPMERWFEQRAEATDDDIEPASEPPPVQPPRAPQRPPKSTGRLQAGHSAGGGAASSGGDESHLGSATPERAGAEGDQALPSTKEWQRALLEDAAFAAGGAPTASPGQPDARGHLAPGPGWTDYEGTSPVDWMLNGTNIGGLGNGSIAGPSNQSPLAPGEQLALPSIHVRPVGVQGYKPTDYPPEARAQVMALVDTLLGPAKHELLARLAHEPLFAYGARQWRQDRQALKSNHEVLKAVFLRYSRLMGTIYGFEPAPLFHTPRMIRGLSEYYDWDHHLAYMSEKLLGGAYMDVMESISHLQTHAFQRQLLVALGQRKLSGPLVGYAELLLAESQTGRLQRVCFGTLGGYQAFDLSYNVGLASAHWR